ncbi:uncharacterized protein LOC144557161 [Carex rostrata]
MLCKGYNLWALIETISYCGIDFGVIGKISLLRRESDDERQRMESSNQFPSKESTDECQRMDYDDQSKEVLPEKQSNKRQRTESDDQSKKIFVKITKTIADQGQRMESGDQSKKNFVKMTKTMAINVTNTDTIDAIKTKVQELEGIALSKQKLFFCRTRLKGTKTLDYHNIQADSCIDLYVKDGITISIQSLDNSNSVSLNVKTSDTVSKIKAMIHDKMGISIFLSRN